MTAQTEAPATVTAALEPDAHEAAVLSMRVLEFALALGALATAVLLGLWH